MLSAHHIVCDGWSTTVIAEELGALYSAYRTGKEPSLPPAPKLTDYIAQKHRFYESDTYREAGNYWIGKFQDTIPVLELPVDSARPPARTYQSRRLLFSIDAPTVASFRQMTRKTVSFLPRNIIHSRLPESMSTPLFLPSTYSALEVCFSLTTPVYGHE